MCKLTKNLPIQGGCWIFRIFLKMWPKASGPTQETKYKNVKISLPSTKQEREKEQNNLRVF